MTRIYKNKAFLNGWLRLVFVYSDEEPWTLAGGDLTLYIGDTMLTFVYPRFWYSSIYRF